MFSSYDVYALYKTIAVAILSILFASADSIRAALTFFPLSARSDNQRLRTGRGGGGGGEAIGENELNVQSKQRSQLDLPLKGQVQG